MATIRAAGLISTTEMEGRHPEIREGWRQYGDDQRILEDYIVETRRKVRLARSTIGSCCEVCSNKKDVKCYQSMTWRQVQERSLQLKEHLVHARKNLSGEATQ